MEEVKEVEIDDEDEQEIDSQSAQQGLLKYLLDNQLLKYGTLITQDHMEAMYGAKKKIADKDTWALFILNLRECIKKQGFFVTSRGRRDDIYILFEEEMPSFNEQKNKVAFKNLQLRQKSLYKIDESKLSENKRKKLEFEIMKNAKIEFEMHCQVNSRCRY